MIEKLINKTSDSLIEVMKTINNNGMGISFIVDANNKLSGIVTDGDIRNAILKSYSLDASIVHVMNTEFVYASIDEDYHSYMSKISDKVSIIPLVNDKKEVVDLFEFKQNSYFPVAIPNLNGNEFIYLTDAFMSTWISSSGKYIDQFEHNFAQYSNCDYGVSVANGTVALHLALTVLDIGYGDEVIVPDLTFAATINSVLHANATPVIVDIEKDSWCINPQEIEKAITPKTKAIIPVHLYGQVCDMKSIIDIAKRYNLKVIEDCAEAHGAMYNGKKVGSFGDIGCFSFFGNKVITTGEGGMCTTNNQVLDEKMRLYRDHGMSKSKKYLHEVVGYNYRMTNMQAAIGVAQLERIDFIHEKRRIYENTYKDVLNNTKFHFQHEFQDRSRITWLVSILLDESINKEEYVKKLKQEGIDVRDFFQPLSSMKIYEKYCKNKTPVSHDISKYGINLPTYESLKSLKDLKKILKNINV
jgi:perosamine synthetase